MYEDARSMLLDPICQKARTSEDILNGVNLRDGDILQQFEALLYVWESNFVYGEAGRICFDLHGPVRIG